MRAYRLKRWQRILIVLSIFWMIFGAAWGWKHANDRVDAAFKDCLTRIETAADVQACRAARAQATVPQWMGAAVAALAPVGLFWLALYGLIYGALRIKRSFGARPEPAGAMPTLPKPASPAPEAIQSKPASLAPALEAPPSPAFPESPGGSRNKRMVESYMEAFRRSDHQRILSCLTEDIEWLVPGLFHVKGKEAFDREIENEAFRGSPVITLTRLIEEGDVVVAEGSVRAARRDGGTLNAVFCDVFEMRDGKIRRLTSYLMEVKS